MTKGSQMTSKAVFLIVGIVTAISSTNAFAESDRMRFQISASQCNHDGLQPNHAAGLGNWTGSTKWAFCGVPRGYDYAIFPTKVYKVGNVVCDMRHISNDGSWYWLTTASGTTNHGTYETINIPSVAQIHLAGAVQCQVPNNALLNTIISDIGLVDER